MPERSLYARTAHVVLTHKGLAMFTVAGSLMHAAGHALIAAAGGLLARGLAGGPAPMDGGSTLLVRLGSGDVWKGLAIAGLFAAIVKLVGGVLAAWSEARVAGEVGEELRREVLDGLLAVHGLRSPRQDDHGPARPGAGLASLTAHVRDVERGVGQGVLAEARGIVQLAPLAVLLVVLAPRLAGSAAAALAAFAALVLSARRALRRGHARAAVDEEALVGAADEAVGHAELWATYGAEAKIRAHVAALGRAMVATAARLRARGALLSGTSEVLGALALVLVLALVSAGAIVGADRGRIVPFSIAFFMAYKPLREIVEARLARGRAEEALAAALASISRARPAEARPRRAWPLAELRIEGLETAYGAHAPLSMRVPPGSILAIVGPTGVGKTALVRALLGLDAAAGTVRYGGARLDQRGVGPSERPFAWVAQEAPVLAASLEENVRLGAPAEVDGRSLLVPLGAGELAESIGGATLVTERTLSGGERQLVALARALATELPVLLLDEPTSALDREAQGRVLGAIAALRGQRSVILVTHRPEPLAIADVVVQLNRRSRFDSLRDLRTAAGSAACSARAVPPGKSDQSRDLL